MYSESTEQKLAREAKKKANQEQHGRELARLRQQRHREKVKRDVKDHGHKAKGKRAKEAVLGTDPGLGRKDELADLAEVSRPEGKKWKSQRNGKKGGVIQRRHERVNWYHPYLWTHISRIAPRVCWSPNLIVSALQREFPTLFSCLHRGTVHKWISKNGKRWSTQTQKNVARRSVLARSGRAGILAAYPEIVEEIKEKITGYRASGVTVSRLIARSVMIAIIQARKPMLLSNVGFKCTEQFVGQFLESVLDYSVRHGTRAAAHLPANASELCLRSLYRCVHLVVIYDVPSRLRVNMDQTGVGLVMAGKTTYEKKGSRQVDIHGADEKRSYTLCVASTPDGDLLPFQVVWSGATSRSLPSKDADGYDEAIELGFDFTFAASKKATSHFSTLKTMKEWMQNILKPWVAAAIETLQLPEDQKTILFIDCYPVHIGEEFRIFVFREFPHVFLIFIPANCTGMFQPADVGIQRLLKHFLRQQMLEWLIKKHAEQLASGLTPEQVKFSTSYPVLRNASVRPIVEAFKFFNSPNGRDIICKAWEKCAVDGYNLGNTCIDSRATKAAYRQYLATDEVFRNEIRNKLGQESLESIEADLEEDTGNSEMEDNEEDTSVPFDVLIKDVSGLEVNSGVDGDFVVGSDALDRGDDGVYRPTGQNEDVWSYEADGTSMELVVQSANES